MLKHIKSRFVCHYLAARASLQTMYQHLLATTMTILVIALTLMLPALLSVFTDNFDKWAQSWQKNERISLYLNQSLSLSDQTEVLAAVRAQNGVGQAILKTPEDGLRQLQNQEGMEDILALLPENPLPPLIEVVPELQVNTPEKVQALVQALRGLEQVQQAKLDMQWVYRLHALVGIFKKVSQGLMVLISCAVVIIIGNTLRLAVHTRHEEIKILKLIGAPDLFILRPFLYTGIWYGSIGGLVALLLSWGFIFSLSTPLQHVSEAYQIPSLRPAFSIQQASCLIIGATILGLLAAYMSVKKQLNAIEPYH